ncbi:ABC transporter ATP-binding protein [Aquimarina brevivitae]|uniref:ABC-type Fe3+/spermidine/putrescine transport system ATPase subunit n=1 Tax=Aquimarina brevivitae TaxID=323412 RepID=A0A4Q7PG96_9FLAO|nr:ABC transporter ATP-binding protein [Aquimarina brevivitae]RZS99516.1 ABC-type Fe3+/spermidine/putrescine transport system ATPase subunit [Aquimarina brevivitae]
MLRVENLTFAYDKLPVLKDISFTIDKGQHVALIGASGCGKSTLLKLIYGLLHAEQGNLFWEHRQLMGPLFNLVPGEENMKYLSQGFELQAFRTVAENIGEFLSNTDQESKKDRVDELLAIVEMEELADVKIERLSGGQKQRVALAKALAKKPQLLLLDEPFHNIDNFRRSALRRNLFRFLKRHNITSITATHDKTDILSFTDQTLVIKQGELIAQQPTVQLYQNPKDYYIASLFGEVNKIQLAAFGQGDDKRYVLIYPDEIKVDPDAQLQVRVKNSYFNGSHYLIEAVLDNQIIFFNASQEYQAPELVGIAIAEEILNLRK